LMDRPTALHKTVYFGFFGGLSFVLLTFVACAKPIQFSSKLGATVPATAHTEALLEPVADPSASPSPSPSASASPSPAETPFAERIRHIEGRMQLSDLPEGHYTLRHFQISVSTQDPNGVPVGGVYQHELDRPGHVTNKDTQQMDDDRVTTEGGYNGEVRMQLPLMVDLRNLQFAKKSATCMTTIFAHSKKDKNARMTWNSHPDDLDGCLPFFGLFFDE